MMGGSRKSMKMSSLKTSQSLKGARHHGSSRQRGRDSEVQVTSAQAWHSKSCKGA